ncbi:hypothetical protein AX17_003709 [Amanita inopinata Kibby_2008]|nr:hypothetical protein AX17_003709 [Amanita inopinata Kibby_2008]
MDHPNGQPPTPTSFVNSIDLTSTKDSKILGVSVYSGRAEITRLFTLSVKTGQNQITINGLPNVLDRDSLRVEGRGRATIHDVTIANMPIPPKPTTSPALDGLKSRKDHVSKALERCERMREALAKYLSTLHVEHVTVGELDKIVEGYDATEEKLDEKILDLQKQLSTIEEQILKEKDELGFSRCTAGFFIQLFNQATLGLRTSLSIFAEAEGEAELILKYAVTGASWSAFYDVRVDTQTKETPVSLIYKAAITQNTGENWEDVPLTLETATPTFGVGIPTLHPWTVSARLPYANAKRKSMRSGAFGGAPPAAAPMAALTRSATITEESEREVIPFVISNASVSSKGNVSATFSVPGTITVPSDGSAHNVTIVQLKLDATMSWVAVPKLDAKMRLSAKIKNASEYTLLSGTASIYVDGSFISKSTIPAVSPEESFDCALGLDPAVRITYHPLSKKMAQTGFYSKSKVNTFSQHISIHNTKSFTIANLRVVDQIPVSEDESIAVKLISPSLPADAAAAGVDGAKSKGGGSNSAQERHVVQVSQGVIAQWGDGTEDSAGSEDGLMQVGRDGKLSWICEVAAQGKVNLLLQWEVISPVRLPVYGL